MSPILAYFLVSLAHAAPSADVPQCRNADLAGQRYESGIVEAHRQTPLPAVVYRDGAAPPAIWGFRATLRIDAEGRVGCYLLKSAWTSERASSNAQRQAWLKQLAVVRYRPFPQSPAIVDEPVREVRAIQEERQPPDVPMQQVVITLDRSGCYGTCPSYKVQIRGDGSVTWTGRAFVDVRGEHRYRIAPAEVRKLVDSVRAKRLWSMEKEYKASISDAAEHDLTLQFGDSMHAIADYAGSMVGMPVEVDAFQAEVDEAAGTRQWIDLAAKTVAQFERASFDAKSPDAGAMLWRAAVNRSSEDKAIARLVALGVPTNATPPNDLRGVESSGRLVDALLRHQHHEAAKALLETGALDTGGRFDQAKSDAAFRAAVRGGRLAGVEAVWAAAGNARPALMAEDIDRDGKHRKTVPIALLLRRDYGDEAWEGLRIAQWLVAHGGSLRGQRADADTLLHAAADANDLAFVRYLLDQGLAPSAPGQYGLPAIDTTNSEDVALLLLEAASQASTPFKPDANFLDYAEGNRWRRVMAWLDKHKP